MKTIYLIAGVLLLWACGPEEEMYPPNEELTKLRAEEEARLSSAKKVEGDRYQIPIDHAMDLVSGEKFRGVKIAPKPKRASAEEIAAAKGKLKELVAAATLPTVTADAGKASQGKALFTSKTCNACHSIDGTRLVGPSLKGLFNRGTVTMNGEAFVNTADYFRESTTKPQVKIVDGFPPSMPDLKLSDADVDLLMHYVASL